MEGNSGSRWTRVRSWRQLRGPALRPVGAAVFMLLVVVAAVVVASTESLVVLVKSVTAAP